MENWAVEEVTEPKSGILIKFTERLHDATS